MTVFFCSKCGAALTQELEALPGVPELKDLDSERDPETRRAPSTVPRGYYAIDTEPWGAPYVPQQDQEDPEPAQPRSPFMIMDDAFVISAGMTNSVVVHPDDVPDLQPLPDWANSAGCCGLQAHTGSISPALVVSPSPPWPQIARVRTSCTWIPYGCTPPISELLSKEEAQWR
ncbi:hypothetical protein [Thermomonospora cellulosilytica]|uniref:Uncharacterized protein n=1 Tax=Thermomonospora cellulosilytica TaxID=1411118 RepID=A0A7W3MYM4_9ACTN|nr:hypothetical protein [Thermomonospora cellulosilytica]MBA9004237.1 hypothetical protein [Thermomonospora cellulosilytica]